MEIAQTNANTYFHTHANAMMVPRLHSPYLWMEVLQIKEKAIYFASIFLGGVGYMAMAMVAWEDSYDPHIETQAKQLNLCDALF